MEFGPGQDVAQITITLLADQMAENDEVIYVTLTRILESGSTLENKGATLGKSNVNFTDLSYFSIPERSYFIPS